MLFTVFATQGLILSCRHPVGAVLIKRWQTKCADKMEVFCSEIALLVEKLRL